MLMKTGINTRDYIGEHSHETKNALIDAWFREDPFPAMIEEVVYEWGQAWLDENQGEFLSDY